MTCITIFRDRFAKGWPRHNHGDRAYVLPLGAALQRPYSTDAHFAAYCSPNDRRLTREALDAGVAVEMVAIAFDVDCALVHGTPQPAPNEWREELTRRVAELEQDHPGSFSYETRGGHRIVYGIDPTIIASHSGALRWAQDYAVCIAHLANRYGIVADPACADWTRLFRLPHATREPGGKPENRPTFGDAKRIDVLRIEATTVDVTDAKRASKAFRDRREMEFAPVVVGGEGLLFHLLAARGWIIRQTSNAWVVRCPRESDHSTGRVGDGSTLLYAPARGEHVGAIHCMHAHCIHMTVREWVREFSSAERDAAARAAGIERRVA